jgi:hypothetical protein
MASTGFHVLYTGDSIAPVICKRPDWKKCPEHNHLSEKRPNIKPARMTAEEFAESISQNSESVSANQYMTGFSVKSLVKEAQKRKGSELTEEELQVAALIGQWYEDGDIKQYRSFGRVGDYNIGFNKMKPIQKGNKTIGIVEIGSEGFKYFYEVEDGKVTIRNADKFDTDKGKLPFNYGMRSALDGVQISKLNDKWGTESFIGAHGL